MEKNIKNVLMFCTWIVIISLSSCLKSNLPTYPLWGKNMITNVHIEVRYNSNETYYGKPIVAYTELTVHTTIDTAANTVSLDIAVPPASGSFTDSIRNLVTKKDLWPYFDISTAAKMTPEGSTPAPGFSTDFTKPQSYIVTAANGDKRKWTVNVTSFTK